MYWKLKKKKSWLDNITQKNKKKEGQWNDKQYILNKPKCTVAIIVAFTHSWFLYIEDCTP